MQAISNVVQLRTVQARPILAGGMRVTPESQVLAIRLPFGHLSFVGQRPTAVAIEREGRPIQRVPIVDLTRAAQLGALLGTLMLTAVCLLVLERGRP